MKHFATSVLLAGMTALPSVALADWTGQYFGVSAGNSSNAELEISGFGTTDDGVYPFTDSTTLGIYYGGLTQSGSFVYGGEIELLFAADAEFASDVTLDAPIVDMKGRAGVAVDRFLAYGVLGIAATPATFGPNDINAVGFSIGAGIDVMLTDNLLVGAEYLTRATGSDEFVDVDADIKLDTISVRVSYKF